MSHETSEQGASVEADARSVEAETNVEQRANRLARGALLAATAIQDLSGPLTYVLSNLEYIEGLVSSLEHDLPPGRIDSLRQCLREVMTGANRVRDIVADLRPQAPTSRTTSELDVHQVLVSSIKVARTQVTAGAQVLTELDEVPPVTGYESRLSRVFVNLLVNAAQALESTPTETAIIRITTRNDPDHGVVIEISDTGPGIPEAHLKRVFEPFFTTKPATQGTGLGLSTCRRIVEDICSVSCLTGSTARSARSPRAPPGAR